MDEAKRAQSLNFAQQSPVAPSTPIYHFMGLTERDFESDFMEQASILQVNELKEEEPPKPEYQVSNVKKGRGRPKGSFKKNAISGIRNKESINKIEKRGRPKKIKIEQIETNPELVTNDVQTTNFDRDAVINEMMKCADILRSHGDTVVITINSSNNPSIIYPDDLASKVTEFLSSNLGINLTHCPPRIQVSETSLVSVYPSAQFSEKKKLLNAWLLNLYRAQLKSSGAKRIFWSSVFVSGWPDGIGQNLDDLLETELDAIFDAYMEGKISFIRRKKRNFNFQ